MHITLSESPSVGLYAMSQDFGRTRCLLFTKILHCGACPIHLPVRSKEWHSIQDAHLPVEINALL